MKMDLIRYKRAALTISILVPSVAVAGLNWTESGHVTEVQTIVNGSGWYLKTDAPVINPANCSQGDSGVYAADNSTHSSIILMAMATGKKVTIGVDTSNCAWNKPKIDRVKIKSTE